MEVTRVEGNMILESDGHLALDAWREVTLA
jgi:hypothetical protein